MSDSSITLAGIYAIIIGVILPFAVILARREARFKAEEAERAASVADLTEAERIEHFKIKLFLREYREEQDFQAELARIARGPSAFAVIGVLVYRWFLFCIFIAVTRVTVRWVIAAI
jgi:hypothetical protein